MKVIKGNADAITCAGVFFSVIKNGKVLETFKKFSRAYDAKTLVVDGRAVVNFKIDTCVGALEVECTPAEWRGVSDNRGAITRTTTVVKRAVQTAGKKIFGKCGTCGSR